MSEHEEQLLIAGCRRGEAWAQKKLYELHASVMMGVCLRYVKNYETAQDILQEGFIKVFTKIHTYAGSGSFGGWMRKVFVSTALEYLRQHQAEQKKVSLSDCEETLENISATDIERISADDILRCIQSLPEGYQTVFNLYAIEGYSHAEIAKILKIKEVTSRSQFIRAKRLLQKKLQFYI